MGANVEQEVGCGGDRSRDVAAARPVQPVRPRWFVLLELGTQPAVEVAEVALGLGRPLWLVDDLDMTQPALERGEVILWAEQRRPE